jgi:DNA invertase Pin-like site-specific DNA recombinase
MTTENHCVSSTEPIRCAIYARTASERQLGNSAEQQIYRCREVARQKGWTVVETHIRADCGKSGTSMDQRTGLHDLMALAATRPRPFDYLMCASTDRLARNLDTAGRIIGNLTFNLFGFDSPPLAASA